MVTTNPSSVLWQLRQLTPPRPLNVSDGYRVAELQANRFLKLAGIDEPGTPDELVTALRFVQVVVRREPMPTSGLSTWLKPRWLVLLDGSEPYVRRRFSLFHEFKHVLDHPFQDFIYPATYFYSSEHRKERAADYFAACVLMPKRLVVRQWGQRMQDEGALARAFGVSEVAMHRRLQDLGLLPKPERCGYVGPPKSAQPPTYFRSKSTMEAVAA